ncbi:hypothetical protein TSTA_077420 [Talaromyces stipitatus ATCC 10500]|uniref:Uncharacterized protein n=1 Tax=Talaromyces stipitatus (strain ATCC 10500 / CBS 375.48 / QM 6759 / NRRL 1006) TaxID=441959 RepID=B8LW13_TALSN|nr:uncharacterized protein TSTA_077420 [Talaromyces stipitatus ATCC 10500]EED24379.1 hypothetical protein TSTA_077420 [Talaromyces stipitatus ATCC 10500]
MNRSRLDVCVIGVKLKGGGRATFGNSVWTHNIFATAFRDLCALDSFSTAGILAFAASIAERYTERRLAFAFQLDGSAFIGYSERKWLERALLMPIDSTPTLTVPNAVLLYRRIDTKH